MDQLGFSEKETSFAAPLLEKHSTTEAKGFIDFGIMEAKKTNFDIKTLGGLKKDYLPYMKELSARGKAMQQDAKEQTKKEEDRRLAAYEAYREKELARIRATLSKVEIAALDNSVRQELESLHPGSKIFTGWIRQRGDRFLAEKHGTLSFDEWQKRCG